MILIFHMQPGPPCGGCTKKRSAEAVSLRRPINDQLTRVLAFGFLSATVTFLSCLFFRSLWNRKTDATRPARQVLLSSWRHDHVLDQRSARLLRECQLVGALVESNLDQVS